MRIPTPFCRLVSMLCMTFTLTGLSQTLDVTGNSVDGPNYGLLMDAGSTSTKLKVYRWSKAESHKHTPTVHLVVSKRFKPGLSEFKGKEEELKTYLTNILDQAKASVPEDKQKDSPIYLYATAGMRYFSAESATHLMSMVRSLLLNTSISPFQFSLNNAQIISGEEEGVYAWIAVNYLNGFFEHKNLPTKSAGVLEMGGGSTQIAFVPTGPLYSEEFQVRVAGVRYQLYVQSYFNFGSNGIRDQVIERLATAQPRASKIWNPCMLTGDQKEVTLDSGRTVTLHGQGDPDRCLQELREILKPGTGSECQLPPCAIGSVYQPAIPSTTFYASGAFTFTPKTLGVLGEDSVLDINKLQRAAEQHCRRDLDTAVAHGVNKAYASSDCLIGLYTPTLLTLSYGFPRDANNIRVVSKIRGERIDWALGAMLLQVSSTLSPNKDEYSVVCPTTAGNTATSIFSGQSVMSVLLASAAIVWSQLH